LGLIVFFFFTSEPKLLEEMVILEEIREFLRVYLEHQWVKLAVVGLWPQKART